MPEYIFVIDDHDTGNFYAVPDAAGLADYLAYHALESFSVYKIPLVKEWSQ